jgi:ADP-ribosyl-[dinitrogen reductase] hydrolase
VFQAFVRTDDFESAMVDVVNRGGDADTTGAILGMIAGALYGPAELPSRWVHHLKRQVRDDCVAQARALIGKAPICAVASR